LQPVAGGDPALGAGFHTRAICLKEIQSQHTDEEFSSFGRNEAQIGSSQLWTLWWQKLLL
jgi:hypothetical protein